MSAEVMDAAVAFVEHYLDMNETISSGMQLCVTDYLTKDLDHRSKLNEAFDHARHFNLAREPNERKRHLRHLTHLLSQMQDMGDERQRLVEDVQDMINAKRLRVNDARIRLNKATKSDDNASNPEAPSSKLSDADILAAQDSEWSSGNLQSTNRKSFRQVFSSTEKKKRPRMSCSLKVSDHQPPAKRVATSSSGSQSKTSNSHDAKGSGRRIANQNRNVSGSSTSTTNTVSRKRPPSSTSTNSSRANNRRKDNNNQQVQQRENSETGSNSGRRGEKTTIVGDKSDRGSSSPEPHYCMCDSISYGEMIACDNESCPIEWFHFNCVGVYARPKGKWYCPKCRGESAKSKRPDA